MDMVSAPVHFYSERERDIYQAILPLNVNYSREKCLQHRSTWKVLEGHAIDCLAGKLS